MKYLKFDDLNDVIKRLEYQAEEFKRIVEKGKQMIKEIEESDYA